MLCSLVNLDGPTPRPPSPLFPPCSPRFPLPLLPPFPPSGKASIYGPRNVVNSQFHLGIDLRLYYQNRNINDRTYSCKSV